MEQISGSYPMKLFIKQKAKALLQSDRPELKPDFDHELFHELLTTLFKLDSGQQLDKQCSNRESAAQIEEAFAAAITKRYRSIKENQQNQLIQRLNALLTEP